MILSLNLHTRSNECRLAYRTTQRYQLPAPQIRLFASTTVSAHISTHSLHSRKKNSQVVPGGSSNISAFCCPCCSIAACAILASSASLPPAPTASPPPPKSPPPSPLQSPPPLLKSPPPNAAAPASPTASTPSASAPTAATPIAARFVHFFQSPPAAFGADCVCPLAGASLAAPGAGDALGLLWNWPLSLVDHLFSVGFEVREESVDGRWNC